jgi:hypothetical protein
VKRFTGFGQFPPFFREEMEEGAGLAIQNQ